MIETKTTEDIDLPENVFVPCPSGGRWDNVRVATACIGCEHFRGLFGKIKAGAPEKLAALPFVKLYSVNCGHPVPREMLEVKL